MTKFLVLKSEDIAAYLSAEEQKQLDNIISVISTCRRADDRDPAPQYWVVGTDEPYADKIREMVQYAEDLDNLDPESSGTNSAEDAGIKAS